MKTTNRNRHHSRRLLMGWLSLRTKLVRHGLEAFYRDRAAYEAEPPQTWDVKGGIPATKLVNVSVKITSVKPWDPVASIEKYVHTLLVRRPR